MITIVIININPIIRVGMEFSIRQNFGEISILTSDSLEHFNQINSNEIPYLIILGNTVESQNIQCELIIQLQRENKQTKIVVYDENPDFFKVSHYFKSGVTGYLTKSSDISELLKCIVDVQNGKKYISNEILEVLLIKWSSGGNDYLDNNKKLLTQREYEIAVFLINGDTVSSISRKLKRKVSTISTTKKNIFKKLEITNIMDLKNSLNQSI